MLQSLIYNIKAQRVQKREDKRADRLKEREQNTPPLPKGLEDWAKKTGIGTEHFLYYKRHGRYADIACSACGQVTEAAVRSKDTYEGQFEKIIRSRNMIRWERALIVVLQGCIKPRERPKEYGGMG